MAASSWDLTTSCPAETGGRLKHGHGNPRRPGEFSLELGDPLVEEAVGCRGRQSFFPAHRGQAAGQHRARAGRVGMRLVPGIDDEPLSAISGPTSTSKKPEAPAVRPQPDQPESIPADRAGRCATHGRGRCRFCTGGGSPSGRATGERQLGRRSRRRPRRLPVSRAVAYVWVVAGLAFRPGRSAASPAPTGVARRAGSLKDVALRPQASVYRALRSGGVCGGLPGSVWSRAGAEHVGQRGGQAEGDDWDTAHQHDDWPREPGVDGAPAGQPPAADELPRQSAGAQQVTGGLHIAQGQPGGDFLGGEDHKSATSRAAMLSERAPSPGRLVGDLVAVLGARRQ